jgi:hypothetical protein
MFSKFFGWIESIFGKPTVQAPVAPPPPKAPVVSGDTDIGYDKTGGWNRAKKGGWAPHGDGGME